MAVAAALNTGRVLFLDVAVGLAVVGFVATIVWARLIDKSPGDRP
jgi:multicomponent Na+:H+ antiporter subunit F